MMHEVYLTSVRDTLLVGIPFIIITAVAIFRLDAILGSPKSTRQQRRPGCGMDENGEPILVDPDGRVPEMPRRRK